MKFLTAFLGLLAVAVGSPVVKTWTLSELSTALELKSTDPSFRPYLEEALNQIMLALFTGKNERFIHAVLPSPVGGSTWTLSEVTKALSDPKTRPEHRPGLMQAYAYIMNNNATGELEESVEVAIPALDISTWTPTDLSVALKNPEINPVLVPYLVKAHKEFKKALSAGEDRESISIVTPVGLVPTSEEVVLVPKLPKRFFKKYIKGLH